MDFWIASVSDGATIEEQWLEGELSPWQRVMLYCTKRNEYLTGLRMHFDSRAYPMPANAQGYWQAQAMYGIQGLATDSELHIQRGIGYVKDGIVNIAWFMRDLTTHKACWTQEQRSIEGQNQIIWSKKWVD